MDFAELRAYYYNSEKINKDDIIWGLLELGVDVTISEYVIVLNDYTQEQYQELEKTLGDTDFVVTQNFSLMMAELCYQKNLPYISWVYDSPQVALYHKEAFYPTSYVFAFDRTQVERLKALGLKQVYYQPLAANIARASALNITDEEIVSYKADVAFVGTLYKKDYFRPLLGAMDPVLRKAFWTELDALACDWRKGKNVFGKLDPAVRAAVEGCVIESPGYLIDQEYLTDILIVSENVSSIERKRALTRLAERFETRLYTYSKVEEGELPGVEIHPKVSRESEMYKVFFAGKINLNLTMRSIETGVPQRIFDIMSVGGFAMSNYQEEMEELFVPDKEIVLFHDLDEMVEKAAYYLSHEKERLKIAMAGYQKVREEYNYPKALKRMLEIALS